MFRIKKATEEKYSYALDEHDASIIKVLGILGIISISFVVLGYVQFLHISPYLSLLFGPILIVILLYHIVQYFLLAAYPGFDVNRHRQKVADFWTKKRTLPSVAVFIPAAGESIETVAETVRTATAIDYPTYQVFLLDDSKNAIYKHMATEFNIGYLRRPNIGEFKKAGNMNFGLKQVKGFQHILVLDADFRPRPEILRELVPYTGEDIGIIQTPQHFSLDIHTHTRSKIEYGAAYIQRDFYRITQVARNRFGAAICVGTSALYNIDALNRVGGYEGVGQPRGWAHSEDVHTGLKMLNVYNRSDKRYKITYVPIQLAKGSCPDDHHSFYKQQNRWATGSMQLLFSKKTIRSNRLSFMQRIIYGSNSLYYFYTISLLASPLYLLALALSSQPSSWAFTLYFIPSLLYKFVVEPYAMRRERAPLATSLVVISNAYTFLQALVLLIIRKPLGWEATGTKGTKKSLHFTNFKLGAAVGFIAMYIVTFGVLIMNEHFQFGPSLFVVCLFLTSFFAHIAFLYYLLIVGKTKDKLLLDSKFYGTVCLLLLSTTVVVAAYSNHRHYNISLQDNRIAFEKQDSTTQNSGNIVDGYRRTVGDIKQMLGI